MEIKLRDYQLSFVNDIRQSMISNKHIMAQLGTGGGKTVCFSYIAKNAINKNNKILIVTNRVELLTQSGNSLENIGVSAEYINPKQTKIPKSSCIIAMAQTLRRRIIKPEWIDFLKTISLFILDEAHLQDFEFLFESGVLDNKFVLGFSATPSRTGKQKQLGLNYSSLVSGISVKELINRKYLVPADHWTLDCPDLSNIDFDSKIGDFNTGQLNAIFSSKIRYSGVISNYNKICPNSKSICFCVSQAHAINMCKEFNDAGIPSKFLISGISKDNDDYYLYEDNKHLTGNRGDIIEEFKNNEFKILCNASILTTGFDEPSIETVIVNRATLSQSLWLQMIGRGSRIYPNKEKFTILDFGDNVKRHGIYDANREWSLWHEENKGGGIAMSKECPSDKKDKYGKCGCNRLLHISMSICPFCGYTFATEKELREIELTKIIDGKFELKDMSPKQLLAYAELKGYKEAWVYRQLFNSSKSRYDFTKYMEIIGQKNPKFIYITYNRLKNSYK